MRKWQIIPRKKERQYPIERDEYGQSLRQRAFNLFWEGHRPARVSGMLPISTRTACRYFEDWKKLNNRVPYSSIRKMMKKTPELSKTIINMLADYLGVPAEQVVLRMQKPWGLMQLIRGEFPNSPAGRAKTANERRLEAALRLVLFADLFQEKKPEVLKEEIGRIIFGLGTKDSEQDKEE